MEREYINTYDKYTNPHIVEYVEKKPIINDIGIFMPCEKFVPKGIECDYNLVMTKEIFIEAYNKWIKGVSNETK